MDKIKTIAHLADIHIRKLHRFVEYRDVFDRLYAKLKEAKPDLIYIGGDIVHGKLDTSPEEIRLVSNFFLSLAEISDLLIIPGNHDCNLNNKSREDVLSPIVDLVKQINPKVHYWKKSGVYDLGGCKFGFLSVFDITKDGKPNIANLPNASDIDGDDKIAVFHGGVGKFIVDTGMWMSDDVVKSTYFEGYDLVLLGDIHKRQFLDDKKTIAYPGSLIQQNFAEAPEHGFLLWDVESRKSEFIQVENDYGFKTVLVEAGEIKSKMSFIPKYGNIKIKYKNTSIDKLRLIELNLRQKHQGIKQVVMEKLDSIGGQLSESKTKISIEDIHDLTVQNNLIEKVLETENPNIDDKTIKRIYDINELTNSAMGMKNDLPRNVDWKLKYIEFDNMFSYGKKNKIDFTKLNGVVGVVAPNHSGKSALIDIIAYTIFDTCSRTNRAIEVLNNKSRQFEVKLAVEVNGLDYIIHRVGKLKIRTTRKTGQVTKLCPVSVKFYTEENGELIDLSGAARNNSQYGSGTNEEIRNILGSFDDFILTSLSLQNNGQNFIDKKQSERKQILSQFMGIDLFDKLYDVAKQDVADEKAVYKKLDRDNLFSDSINLKEKIKLLKDDLMGGQERLKYCEGNLRDGYKIKDMLTSQLKEVGDIKNIDFEKQITMNEYQLGDLDDSLQNENDYKNQLRELYNSVNDKLKTFNEDKLTSDFNEFQHIKSIKTTQEHELKLLGGEIQSLEKKKKELEKYHYNEDCDYCLDNGKEQIKQKHNCNVGLSERKEEYVLFNSKYTLTILDHDRLQNAESEKQKFDGLVADFQQITGDAYKSQSKIKESEKQITECQIELEKLFSDKIKYEKNKSSIEQNKQINQQLDNTNENIDYNEKSKNKLIESISSIKTTIAVSQTKLENVDIQVKQFIDIEQKIQDYELYLKLVSNDGIPQLIINDALPIIESEVNIVLDHMMAGFQLGITNEDKSINLTIRYDDQEWPLNLSSGMEKFVSSLALRVGLINVSNLPCPNFLVIDEGFGSLDSENLSNMRGAFDYLKTRFQSVFIISHLDTIKDFMDYLLPINNTSDGYSKITYN
jgi:DNA repair exonuclease SbcCD ATPase subunit